MLVLLLFTSISFISAKYIPCKPQDFGHGSVVCECSVDYCDGFEGMPNATSNSYIVYTSSKDGLRFHEAVGKIIKETNEATGKLKIVVERNAKRQRILGFGGAFTDAAMLNTFQMPQALQSKVFESYFTKFGIEYTIGRIPIASCDFSTHIYSYAESPGDFLLKNFSLATEDVELKIPGIKLAMKYSQHPLKLFGSPWSAPGWMKDSGRMEAPGKLKGTAGDQNHKTWANYFIKFLKTYEANGIPRFWGLTVENEPAAGFTPGYKFQCMGFTSESERDFVKMDLGPALEVNGYSDLNLMILDDQRYFLPSFADTVLDDPDTKKYVKGIGVHWYGNKIAGPTLLDMTHERHPDTFILATEACAGFTGPDQGVILGSWERGEEYGHDIMENMNHWVIGWVDWNFVLNMNGGPNWVKNFVDAPIIWDAKKHLFYKQPTFYHMGHFSKFVTPDSVYIESSSSQTTNLEFAAFQRPDKIIVLVVLNKSPKAESFTVVESNVGTIDTEIPARAIQTYLFGGNVGHL